MSLQNKILAIAPEIKAELRNELLTAFNTLANANNPVGVLASMSRLSLKLIGEILEKAGEEKPSDNLYDCIVKAAKGDANKKIVGLGILPDEIASYLHTIRVLSNKADHAAEKIIITKSDAENVLYLYLRVLEWFYCESKYSLGLKSIYQPEENKNEICETVSNLSTDFDKYLGRDQEENAFEQANPTNEALRAALKITEPLESNRSFIVREIETPAELEDLWKIDFEAYGEMSWTHQHFYECWSAYPKGLKALFYGDYVVGAFGIWSVSRTWAEEIKKGKKKESEITPAMLRSVKAKPSFYWFITGIVLQAGLRNSKAIKLLLKEGFRNWFETNQFVYPTEVLALAYSPEGQALLERFSFRRLQNATAMLDNAPLYTKKLKTENELLDIFRGRGLEILENNNEL